MSIAHNLIMPKAFGSITTNPNIFFSVLSFEESMLIDRLLDVSSENEHLMLSQKFFMHNENDFCAENNKIPFIDVLWPIFYMHEYT